MLRIFFIILFSAISAQAQTTVIGAGGGGVTIASSLPVTCSPTNATNNLVFLTTGSVGLYQCVATNTYTPVTEGPATIQYGVAYQSYSSGATSATITHNFGTKLHTAPTCYGDPNSADNEITGYVTTRGTNSDVVSLGNGAPANGVCVIQDPRFAATNSLSCLSENNSVVDFGVCSATIGPTVVTSDTPVPVPAAPIVTTVGAAGSTTYGYTIVWYNAVGPGIAGTETTIATGNATLDGDNYNVIAQPIPCPTTGGVLGFVVYRSTPAGDLDFGGIGSAACGDVVNDQGQFGTHVNPPNHDWSTGIRTRVFTIGDSPLGGGRLINDDGLTIVNADGTQGVLSLGRISGPTNVFHLNDCSAGFMDRGEFGCLCDATSGPVSIQLPNAAGTYDPSGGGTTPTGPTMLPGQLYMIKKTDASANACSFAAFGSQTFDGSAGPLSVTKQNETYWIQSDGNGSIGNWKITSHYIPGITASGAGGCTITAIVNGSITAATCAP